MDNGFQANSFVSDVPNADFEFDDESVESFEIGGKHEFADGVVRLNWAAFYSEYSDLQTTIFKGVGFAVSNAASSEVQGLEVDFMMALTDTIRIGVNAAYAPNIGRKEYYRLAELAKKYDVPTFTHVRYMSVKEPDSSFEAVEELIGLSFNPGAHMHICHLNSTSLRDIARALGRTEPEDIPLRSRCPPDAHVQHPQSPPTVSSP